MGRLTSDGLANAATATGEQKYRLDALGIHGGSDFLDANTPWEG